MKYILLLLASLLFFTGCEEAFTKSPPVLAESLNWRGAFALPPESPEENWVYFDTELKETRIFNGETWETMAVSGIDGISLKWLGALDTFPPLDTNLAFFHTKDKISYVCDGVEWNILNSNGKNGLGLIWKGRLDAAPADPEKNWYYYDNIKKASYLFSSGFWQEFHADGLNGLPVIWLGSFKNFPDVIDQNVGFYHEIDGITYIMDDLEWKVLSKDGLEGDAGELIIWKGDLATPPSPALNNWAYYNTVDGNSYIYILETESWAILSRIGKNGEPINWLGIFPEHPDNLKINNAYRNSGDGNCYIFTGSKWEIFSFGGIDGQNGIDGIDVVWKGALTEEPKSPEINWAYLNVNEQCSYIFTEKGWKVLLRNGPSGFEIRLIGSFNYFPSTSTASEYDVFFHTEYGNSYIFNTGRWSVFCQGGTDAAEGESIIWKGELYSTPSGYPEKNWVYYNTNQNITYIYNGRIWKIFIVAPTDGKDGKVNFLSENEKVAPGDSLVLYHNFGSNNITVDGRYLSEDSMYVDWHTPGEWSSYYGITNSSNIYSSFKDNPVFKLLKLKDGGELHAFLSYNGGYYGVFENHIPVGAVKEFTNQEFYDLEAAELQDGTLLFSYRTWDDKHELTKISPDGTKTVTTIHEDITHCNMVVRADESVLLSYVKGNTTGHFKILSREGVLSEETTFSDGCSKNALLLLDNGDVMITYGMGGVINTFVSPDNSMRTAAKWGSLRQRGINDVIQTKDGSIYICYKYVTGYQKYTSSHVEIVKINNQGDSLASTNLRGKTTSATLTELADGSLGAIDVGYDYTTGYYKGTVFHKGVPYFTKINSNLEETYSVQLSEEVTYPQVIPHEDGSLTVTYVDKFDTYAVKTAQLKEIHDGLGVLLKRLSTDHACLINNTGETLDLQISARRYE